MVVGWWLCVDVWYFWFGVWVCVGDELYFGVGIVWVGYCGGVCCDVVWVCVCEFCVFVVVW